MSIVLNGNINDITIGGVSVATDAEISILAGNVYTKAEMDMILAGNSTDVYRGAYGVVYADETMPICTRVGASGYTAKWKLNDDSVVEVTVDEIKQALALAIKRTGEIVKGV